MEEDQKNQIGYCADSIDNQTVDLSEYINYRAGFYFKDPGTERNEFEELDVQVNQDEAVRVTGHWLGDLKVGKGSSLNGLVASEEEAGRTLKVEVFRSTEKDMNWQHRVLLIRVLAEKERFYFVLDAEFFGPVHVFHYYGESGFDQDYVFARIADTTTEGFYACFCELTSKVKEP